MKLTYEFAWFLSFLSAVLQSYAFPQLPSHRHSSAVRAIEPGRRWNTRIQMTEESQNSNEEVKKEGDDENLGLWINLDKFKQSISIPNLLVGSVLGVFIAFGALFAPMVISEITGADEYYVQSTVVNEAPITVEESIARNVLLFDDILTDLHLGFVDPINPSKLFETAVGAMLKTLDPYTEFENVGAARSMQESVGGRYGGVGLIISSNKVKAMPSSSQLKETKVSGLDKTLPLPAPAAPTPAPTPVPEKTNNVDDEQGDKMPAVSLGRGELEGQGVAVVDAFEGYGYNAGLRVGDRLVSVDGVNTLSMNVEQVRDLLRGDPDTDVTIVFDRDENIEDVKRELKVQLQMDQEEETRRVEEERLQQQAAEALMAYQQEQLQYGGVGQQPQGGVVSGSQGVVTNTPSTPVSLSSAQRVLTSLAPSDSSPIPPAVVTRAGATPTTVRKTVTFKRQLVRMSDVRLTTLLGDPSDGIGYINLSGFNAGAGRDFRQAMLMLRYSSPNDLKGLVVDLRGNPGGLLDAAVEIASYLLPPQSNIVSAKSRTGPEIVYKSSVDPIRPPGMKLAVLVNSGSASASEIVAGAIQDLDAGIIVGPSKTYGKGLVQKITPLAYNNALKLTIARYYTPSGRCIQSVEYTGGREEADLAMLPSTTDQASKDGSGPGSSGGGSGSGSGGSSPNKLKLPQPRDREGNGGQQEPKNTKSLNFFGIPLNYLSDPTLPQGPGLAPGPGLSSAPGPGLASGSGLASTLAPLADATPIPSSTPLLVDTESSPTYTTGGLLAVLDDDKEAAREGDIRGSNSKADDIRGGNSRGADIRGGNSRGEDIRYEKLDQPVKQSKNQGNLDQSNLGQGPGLGQGQGLRSDGRLFAWDDRPPPRTAGSLRDSNRNMVDEQGGGVNKPTPTTPSNNNNNNNPTTTKKLMKNKKTRTDGGADISDENRRVFLTSSGREVRDGGGIEPDVTTVRLIPGPAETIFLSQGVYFDFATEYLIKHPVRSSLHLVADQERINREKDERFPYALQRSGLYTYLVLPEAILNDPVLALSGRLDKPDTSGRTPFLSYYDDLFFVDVDDNHPGTGPSPGAGADRGTRAIRTNAKARRAALFSEFQKYVNQRVATGDLSLEGGLLGKFEALEADLTLDGLDPLAKGIEALRPRIKEAVLADMVTNKEQILDDLEITLLGRELPDRLLLFRNVIHDPQVATAVAYFVDDKSDDDKTMTLSSSSTRSGGSTSSNSNSGSSSGDNSGIRGTVTPRSVIKDAQQSNEVDAGSDSSNSSGGDSNSLRGSESIGESSSSSSGGGGTAEDGQRKHKMSKYAALLHPATMFTPTPTPVKK